MYRSIFYFVFFCLEDAEGKSVNLSIYKGKVLLIVNVASKWYTPYLSASSLFIFCYDFVSN